LSDTSGITGFGSGRTLRRADIIPRQIAIPPRLQTGLRSPIAGAPSMTFPRPWPPTRRGIYHFVLTAPSSVLQSGALPDDEEFNKGKQLRWVAGAADGVSRHHGGLENAAAATAILAAVKSVIADPTEAAVGDLYPLLVNNATIGFVKNFIALLDEDRVGSAPELAELARWLATEAPDRGPVKFALALLGRCGDSRDEDIFATLGRHEEFTLFAAAAVEGTLPNPEGALWKLAQLVHGWGRIHIVERLRATTDAVIKRWMLRQGYKNRVMNEYLAYRCATTGGLMAELKAAEPDDELLAGAGDIIIALLRGGPAPDMSAYPDGANAVALYLRHLARRPCKSLDDFLTVHAIKSDVARQAADTGSSPAYPWPDVARREIETAASAILGRHEWRNLAEAGLAADDLLTFRNAASVLEALGIDAWEARFERQRSRDSDEWYWLMKTDDRARIQRVIDLAEEQVELKAIASGPADEIGLGPRFRQHSVLDWLLQELGRFPGVGWSIVAAALRSPVTRNRNWALAVLSAWGPSSWPDEAPSMIEHAIAEEPNIQVLQRARNLLDGRPLEQGVVARGSIIH
jgi:hypothetical protein